MGPVSRRELDDEAMGTGGDSDAGAEFAGVVDLDIGMLGPGNAAKLGWGRARKFCRRSLFLCALMLAFVWVQREHRHDMDIFPVKGVLEKEKSMVHVIILP